MSHQQATLSLPVEYMYMLPTINLLHKNDFDLSVVNFHSNLQSILGVQRKSFLQLAIRAS